MLNSSVEYKKMATTEAQLWWYKSLHQLILRTINEVGREKKIIDAGCGTGGLISFLSKKGFTNLVGFDLSEHAIEFCKAKNLNTFQGDIKNIANYFDSNSSDIIISNDVFYFLTEAEQIQFLNDCYDTLVTKGRLIMNLPALKAFWGIHDISVGIGTDDRFSKKKINHLVSKSKFAISQQLYWPFLLSPIIFSVRFSQRIKLKLQKNTPIESDVELPSTAINNLLYNMTEFEQKYLGWKPWGSSLFIVLEK